jgi:uncharacterized short protein YbdD (DUF466 family)
MLNEDARESYNSYMRKWRKDNPEKVKQIKERYWKKRHKQLRKLVSAD